MATNRNDEIRKEVLFQHWAIKAPLCAAEIHRECQKRRMDYSHQECREAQEFLADDGLLSAVQMPGSSAQFFRINSNGQRHYEQTYAA